MNAQRPATALDHALDERQRLQRAYKHAKRQDMDRLYRTPHGPALKKFHATLNHFNHPDHADRMLEYINREARNWLAYADKDIRHAALEAIGERCVVIRERAGEPPFCDPMPPEENVFFTAKRILGL